MRIAMKNPTEVGADRIVNAVAGREKYGAPVVVVDFGTSTNFDVVNADGDYVEVRSLRAWRSPWRP